MVKIDVDRWGRLIDKYVGRVIGFFVKFAILLPLYTSAKTGLITDVSGHIM